MFKVAVGHSNDPDSQSAINEVLEQCINSLAEEIPKAGILFAAIDFNHQLILNQIHEAFPGIELIGGTTDAEISSVLGFQEDSLTLMLFCTSDIEICAGIGREVSNNPIAAAKEAVEQAQAKMTNPAPKLCLAIPEGLTVGGVAVVDSLKLFMGEQVPIFGGLCGDQMRLEATYQFFRTEVVSNSVPIFLFSGNLMFSHGVASGWNPIGKKSRVNKVDKNTIFEIDDKPALNFYHHYLGQLSPSNEYPLALFDLEENYFYMRAPSLSNQQTGSIKFLAEVPEDAVVQIAQASRDEILAAAKKSVSNALENYPGEEPAAVLVFSCAARRQVLGTLTKEEYQLIKTSASKVLPSCGFYTYGEISPLECGGKTRLHNNTFVTLVLGNL